MALANLGDLKASVADWLNREDLTTQIVDFIALGERRIFDDHRSRVGQKETQFQYTVSFANQVNPVSPAGVTGEFRSLVVNGDVIPFVTWETYNKEKKEPTYSNGCAAVYNDSLYYSGFAEIYESTPTSGDDVEVRGYFYDHVTDGFNYGDDLDAPVFFSTNPNVYLYAALVEASIYLRDLEGVQLYQVRYEELMDKAHKSHKRAEVSGGYSVGSVGGDHYFDRSW